MPTFSSVIDKVSNRATCKQTKLAFQVLTGECPMPEGKRLVWRGSDEKETFYTVAPGTYNPEGANNGTLRVTVNRRYQCNDGTIYLDRRINCTVYLWSKARLGFVSEDACLIGWPPNHV